jgi:transaldolase
MKIMRLFLETANLDEIRKGASFGILDGVTTNPTLAAKENKPFGELILKICRTVGHGVVNAEVGSVDYEGMLREAREVVSWHPKVAAEIPMTPDGVRALSKLSREGLRVNTDRGLQMFVSDWGKARATLGGIAEPAGVCKGAR